MASGGSAIVRRTGLATPSSIAGTSAGASPRARSRRAAFTPAWVKWLHGYGLKRVCIQVSLADTGAELEVGAERLRQCLKLVADPTALYATAPDGTMQQLNATFYQRLYLDDDPLAVVHDERKPPFDEIREAAEVYQRYKELTIGPRQRQTEATGAQVIPLQTNRRRNLMVTAPDDNPAPVLADIFPVSPCIAAGDAVPA